MHAPARTNTVVSTRNLNLILGSDAAPVHILRDIDLEIVGGETVAILGASGSGKTSLMAVLSSLEQASSGEVHVAGADFGAMDEDALALVRRKGIGIVLQSFHLLPTMTALENVAVPMELSGAPDAFARAEAELDKVGLSHRIGHYPAQLSGGEQQRVAIARALAPRPAILFADEPTGNLDGSTSEAIIDLLFARQKDTGATLVIITHDTALASKCGRVIRMADGRIVSDEAA
jgi:putative ABC transport system ATP-binding protein